MFTFKHVQLSLVEHIIGTLNGHWRVMKHPLFHKLVKTQIDIIGQDINSMYGRNQKHVAAQPCTFQCLLPANLELHSAICALVIMQIDQHHSATPADKVPDACNATLIN